MWVCVGFVRIIVFSTHSEPFTKNSESNIYEEKERDIQNENTQYFFLVAVRWKCIIMIIATNENVFGGKETERTEREKERNQEKRRKNEHDFSIGYVDAGRTMNTKQAI